MMCIGMLNSIDLIKTSFPALDGELAFQFSVFCFLVTVINNVPENMSLLVSE